MSNSLYPEQNVLDDMHAIPAYAPLSDHETQVKLLLMDSLSGVLQGFPDSEPKLNNVARAWAKFISLEPYHVTFNPQIEPYMTDDERAQYLRKEGVVPGEWLIAQIRDGCEWMPAPVVAREIYLSGGFPAADGKGLADLTAIGRRRSTLEKFHPVEME